MNSSCKSFSDYGNIRATENAFTSTKSIKAKHPKNLFFGHLNANSIRKDFASIQQLIKRTFNIFLIRETKTEDSFNNLKLKVIKILGKIEMPLEEDFFFTLMKS